MVSPIDEPRYLHLVAAAFRKIEDALETIEPSDVDLESSGDVMTLTLKDGVRCVINTQRPTRQIWLAARARAWHFDLDVATGRWLDDKRGEEFFRVLSGIIKEGSEIDVTFASV